MNGGLADSEERGREGEKEKEQTRDVVRGTATETRRGESRARDDAVVRLQGRRKEEPRREPVPVTGPPAGRRTRHTAPYRPLLSHSPLPPLLYALRPSRPVCYLLANLASRSLQLATRGAFKFFEQCQLACTAALIMLPPLVTMLLYVNCILSVLSLHISPELSLAAVVVVVVVRRISAFHMYETIDISMLLHNSFII